MSQYFNSIARQIGRGSTGPEGRSKLPAAIAAKNPRGDGPLDSEEILMISPVSAKNASSRYDEPATKSPHTEPVRTKKGRSSDEKQNVAAEPTAKTSKQEIQIESSQTAPKKAGPFTADPANDDPVKKETLFVKAAESNAGTNVRSVSKEKDKRAKESGKKQEKVFFEKTSEIIEGRQVEPEEVRTIVMREVQEWVAAVPVEATSEAEIMSSDDRNARAEKPKSANSMVRQRDPVVSIAENPSKAETKTETEYAPAEEHFELSIGTISVIIEGDEKPRVQNEFPPRREQARTTSTDRSASSLLERSYL